MNSSNASRTVRSIRNAMFWCLIIPTSLLLLFGTSGAQMCGDADGNGVLNVLDISRIINYLMLGALPGGPLENSDVDGCGSINIADPAYLAQYLYVKDARIPCDPSVICNPPVGNNSIAFGTPQSYIAEEDSIIALVPIYVTTDVPLVGFSAAIGYTAKEIIMLSVEQGSSVFPASSIFEAEFRTADKQIVLYGICLNKAMEPKTCGLLATLRILVPPGYPLENLDFSFISTTPSWELLFAPLGGGTLTPTVEVCGKGSPNICDIYCGDANSDGNINIKDIAFIISYLYKAGPAPIQPVEADVNNSGAIELLDVSHMVRYLYKGGTPPTCP